MFLYYTPQQRKRKTPQIAESNYCVKIGYCLAKPKLKRFETQSFQ